MSFEFSKNKSSKQLWSFFYDFTQTPRPSKFEGKISEYLIRYADENHFKYELDQVQNILIKVPAKGTLAGSESILIQNHIDMVTDAIEGKAINFKTDPIEAYQDGDWVRARGTTLGADNGIGCAAALALPIVLDNHPPLELLFTVDEETGLTGASGLDGSIISSKKMINLDTEEWGSLYIGCAGGINYEFNGSFSYEPLESNFDLSLELSLRGFAGGHSGVDVHRFRKNAIKAIGELLSQFSFPFRIISFESGKAHNIIPRDAKLKFAIQSSSLEALEELIQKKVEAWNSYVSLEDAEASFELNKCGDQADALSQANSQRFLDILNLFPNGVFSLVRETITEDNLPLVGVSNNLAKIALSESGFYMLTSVRFFNRSEAYELEGVLESLGRSFNLKIVKNSEYPSWEPDFETSILQKAKDIYFEKFKVDPKVKAIHAGLECGILLDKAPAVLEAISLGPTIVDAHSPDERVKIDTVDFFWDYLVKLIQGI